MNSLLQIVGEILASDSKQTALNVSRTPQGLESIGKETDVNGTVPKQLLALAMNGSYIAGLHLSESDTASQLEANGAQSTKSTAPDAGIVSASPSSVHPIINQSDDQTSVSMHTTTAKGLAGEDKSAATVLTRNLSSSTLVSYFDGVCLR